MQIAPLAALRTTVTRKVRDEKKRKAWDEGTESDEALA
jgi:hypothetical protein